MHLVTGSCWFRYAVDWLLSALWLVCGLLRLWDQSFVCGGVCKGVEMGLHLSVCDKVFVLGLVVMLVIVVCVLLILCGSGSSDALDVCNSAL